METQRKEKRLYPAHRIEFKVALRLETCLLVGDLSNLSGDGLCAVFSGKNESLLTATSLNVRGVIEWKFEFMPFNGRIVWSLTDVIAGIECLILGIEFSEQIPLPGILRENASDVEHVLSETWAVRA